MLKKIIVSIVISASFLTLVHCVDDDVCITPTTPRLSFRLVQPSSDTVTAYVLDSLYVDKVNSDGTIQRVGKWAKVSDGKLPLNTDSNETVFNFYKTDTLAHPPKDVIVVKYQNGQKFVSKACGFKFVFENLSYELTQSVFVTKLVSNSTQINDESEENLFIVYNPAP
ncbi:MAG: hypothetical protein LBT29_01810 [Flavobacteriaceae bacterium]|jgi:hypothetical protein|nr:hypothetical protein [Flavobacteriaceae bacterium]